MEEVHLNKVETENIGKTVTVYVVLILICFFVLIPIFWGISTSLKPHTDTMEYPPRWLPQTVTVDNYYQAVRANLPRYFLNSCIYAVGTIVLTLFVAVHAGT